MADINPVTVQTHLKGVDYPANKQELIDKAQQEGASPEVCSALEKLPADRDFQSAADVTQALGQIRNRNQPPLSGTLRPGRGPYPPSCQSLRFL